MRHSGFTLLELSIVIVIIGLIVAGISAGQSLVRQAQLRSVISDVNNFRTAHNSYLLQYDAFPGDMNNAYDYFGALCSGTGSSDADKCNGDGDKQIALVSDADENEAYRYWQHLSLSGLIDGNYTGLAPTAGRQADIGVNVPAVYDGTVGVNAYYSTYNNIWPSGKNGFAFGRFRANTASTTHWISPTNALSIDSKIDDGQWQYGNVIFNMGASATEDCSGGGFPPNTALGVSLDDTTDSCNMVFSMQ